MIRVRKELCRGGSGKPKPLSLSQEMSLSDLRRAAVQAVCLERVTLFPSICAQRSIKMGCNVAVSCFEKSHGEANERRGAQTNKSFLTT